MVAPGGTPISAQQLCNGALGGEHQGSEILIFIL
jgi:hypothetical protein